MTGIQIGYLDTVRGKDHTRKWLNVAAAFLICFCHASGLLLRRHWPDIMLGVRKQQYPAAAKCHICRNIFILLPYKVHTPIRSAEERIHTLSCEPFIEKRVPCPSDIVPSLRKGNGHRWCRIQKIHHRIKAFIQMIVLPSCTTLHLFLLCSQNRHSHHHTA